MTTGKHLSVVVAVVVVFVVVFVVVDAADVAHDWASKKTNARKDESCVVVVAERRQQG